LWSKLGVSASDTLARGSADDPVEGLRLGPGALGGARAVRLAQFGEQLLAGADQRGQHVGVEPYRLQREQQILGGRIATRARREGAATESAQRSVDHRGSGGDRSQRIGHAESPGVVPVENYAPQR